MRLTPTLRLLSHPALDNLKKSLKITVDEAPQYINKIRDEKKKIVYDKLNRLNKWYVKIIGLDEVKLYQERVTSLQEQLLKTQEKRREVGRQLADIRERSLDLQDQLHKVKRQEDLQRFLDLMKEETEILKLENSVSRTFQEYDQMERELFTAFSNAIRDSHEKQRAQLEYTKYFGLVLSIAGSFLAFVYTSVKKQDLKNFIESKLVTLRSDNSNRVVLDLVRANEVTVKEVMKNREALNQVMQILARENAARSLYQYKGDFNIENVDYKRKVAVGVVGTCVLFLLLSAIAR